MFSNPIRIYGNYSRIAKKYSKDNSNEKAEPFVLIDVEGKKSIERKTYIFDTLLECFMTAMMLGIIADKKEPEDSDKTIYATVFADILGKKRATLERIYQHMVLTKYTDLEIDERIKKAFGIIKEEDKKEELENLKSYMRGGLLIIDNYFKDCKTIEDFCNKIIDFKNSYEI